MSTREDNPSDLIKLQEVTNAAIVDTLKYRFQQDEIYTHVGPILVALNPFKWINGLYNDNIKSDYMSGKYDADMSSHPHVFGIAYDAYSALCDDNTDQSILVSGESGSGKTETTKQCLNYLAFATNTKSAQAGSNNITDKILKASTILEAFGNARTVRNNNSSRFGKFIEIWFNDSPNGIRSNTKQILGSSNTTYLLEKTRVVHQDPDERNYHIFYQLLTGASPSLAQELLLGSMANNVDQARILNQSGCTRIPGVDDAKEFLQVDGTFDSLGFSREEKSYIYHSIASCLHLGNVVFQPNDGNSDACQIEPSTRSKQAFTNAASLLGLDPEKLERGILFKVVQTGGFGAAANKKKTSFVHAPYQLEVVYENRNAVIKELYSKCFDFVVAKINERINIQPSGHGSVLTAGNSTSENRLIGILDIFGFEIFKKVRNSFNSNHF